MTNYTTQSVENEQYLERIERAEEKWANSEKKLDLVRDLLGSDQVSKLLDFYKKKEDLRNLKEYGKI